MAITYTWQIKSLEKTNLPEYPGYVCQVVWCKKGTDETNTTGEFSGSITFDTTNQSLSSFVPYSELTEEIVIGWVQNIVAGNYEQDIDLSIADQIYKKKNIQFVKDNNFPWNLNSSL